MGGFRRLKLAHGCRRRNGGSSYVPPLERSGRTAGLDLILITSARLLAILGQLVYIRMFSTHLSTKELGLYFLLITVSYALTAALFIPMDYFQQSRVHSLMSEQGTLRGLLIFNFRMLRIVVIAGVSATLLAQFLRPDLTLAVGVATFAACVQYMSLGLRGYLNNLGYRRRNALSTISETLLKLAFLWVALAIGTSTALGVFTSWALALTVVTSLLLWDCFRLRLFRQTARAAPPIRLMSFVHIGYPISFSSVVNWLQLQGYRMALVPMGFADLVGVYATVANIGSAGMGAASSVFAQMHAPKIYSSNGTYTSTFLRNSLALVAMVAMIGWALSPWIIPLATSPKFRPYAYLIVFGVVAEGGNLLIGAVSAYLSLKMFTVPLLAASVSGLLTVVVLFGLMVTFMEVTFATIAAPLVVSQVVVATHLWLAFRGMQRRAIKASP